MSRSANFNEEELSVIEFLRSKGCEVGPASFIGCTSVRHHGKSEFMYGQRRKALASKMGWRTSKGERLSGQ